MRGIRRQVRPAVSLLAAWILIVGCGTGASPSPPGSSSAPSAPTPGPSWTPWPSPTPLTTPAGTAAPIGPSDLVIRLTWSVDVVAPIPGATVVDDGRVIWALPDWLEPDLENPQGIKARRLTDAGLAWVRARLDETGVLDRTGDYDATLKPGATPMPRGAIGYLLRLEGAGGRIKVTFGDPGDYASEPELWVIPPEMTALAALAHGLMDPEAWIPSEMWAGPATGFDAYAYLVTVDLAAGSPAFGRYPADVDEVAWPFAVPIDQMGSPWAMYGGPAEDGRCFVATAAQAAAMAAAENAAGRSRDLRLWMSDIGYRWARGNGNIVVTTNPLLPYQTADCADAGAW